MSLRSTLRAALPDPVVDTVRDVQVQYHRTLQRLFPPLEFPKPALPQRIFADPEAQIFFGYYDCSPLNQSETLLLAQRTPIGNRMPKADDKLEVGFFDLRESQPRFHAFGETSCWSWQQGSRLRWFPTPRSERVVFNALVDGAHGAVVHDLSNRGTEQTFSRALYEISPDGCWGFSLDFSRLHRKRPGYGYLNFPDSSAGDPAPTDDGLWLLNLETGREQLLFSLAELAAFEPEASMSGAEHYLNHVLVSPSSNRFLFFHLWDSRAGRFERMITANIDGSDPRILVSGGHSSHYCWRDDESILNYATLPDHGTRFYLFEELGRRRRVIGEAVLTQDGHPSFRPSDRDQFVVDRYPDRAREQVLMIYDIAKEQLLPLASFSSARAFSGPVRCDLHPRWSPSGNAVVVDCVQGNRRAIAMVDVSRI